MRALRLSRAPRQGRAPVSGRILAALALAGLFLPLAAGRAMAGPASGSVSGKASGKASAAAVPAGLKQVLYQGYTFDIPKSWPVVDESLHPDSCVRFDEHVVYLGGPGQNQSCPSWLFGTTEAVLIASGPASAPRNATENPISRQITATAPRVSITATFDTDPNVLYTMLSKAGLPAPQLVLPNPALLDAAEGKSVPGQAGHDPATMLAAAERPMAAQPAKAVPVGIPELPATVANYHGLGFDSCAAPSAAYMRKWKRHSPYGAVGIYIGGSDRACDQQNLTRKWVRREARAGWRFIPMYAGPQASFGELKQPVRQGIRAAADAVSQAQRLGFGPRTPIYYDMEAYPAKDTGVALRFLSSWTRALHRLHYRSGVYSSSRSGIVDLARQYAKHNYAMPNAVYDALWNGSRNVRDKSYGRRSWPRNHRLHQFSGNDTRTYGGARIDIDEDYLDIALAAPGGTMQGTPAVESSSVFYEGTGHQLWRKPRAAKGSWGSAVNMGGYLTSRPSVVAVGGDVLDVFYRGKNGYLWLVRHTSGGWQPAKRIALMGQIGSAPQAVAQSNGVVDVFWKGSHDDHLWHGQYSPSRGWGGPQNLGGGLVSAPSPVENRFGGLQVFWEGTGSSRGLWHVQRRLGSRWTKPSSLGMGPLGGPPHAVAMRNGAIEVAWRGATKPHHIWAAYLVSGHRAQGPRDLGGSVSGAPWPSAAQSTVRIFFRGINGRLWQLLYRKDGRWHPPSRVAVGRLGSDPFTAAGMGTGPFEVFWRGVRGGLWAASGSGGSWQGPQRLGGSVR
ncbi:MAG TPA: glycoside hydrolase domain-containing protein [Streptosporangiaceae bacterium]